MLSLIIKIIILVAMVLFIAWVGVCVYSNFIAEPDTGRYDMPDSNEAVHSVYINNTGNLLLTNDYEQHGQGIGHRVFILHGFWELHGQDFKYQDTDLVLNEAIFGEITIRRR